MENSETKQEQSQGSVPESNMLRMSARAGFLAAFKIEELLLT
jgi:hypothetical protein